MNEKMTMKSCLQIKNNNNILTHGGDWAGFEEEYGFKPLDFSANVSPLGMPQSVRNAVVNSLDNADRYPDPLCRSLRTAIALHEGIKSTDFIMCGNGAAELLFRIVPALRPEKALITAPTFAEYEDALKTVDCEVVRYQLFEENNFRIADEAGFLSSITEETDMVFLCQPNNPTGMVESPEFLKKVLASCSRCGAVLVLDECFNDFLDNPESYSMKAYLDKNPNLIILRSFTKMYAMAGLRLGYCMCSNAGFMKKMQHMGQPWAVSDIAQHAGIAALHETEYVKIVRKLTAEERLYLLHSLGSLGIKVLPGEANYLLFKSKPELGRLMRENGILIRDCSNYYGLERGWFRIGIRTHEENEKLVEVMSRLYQEDDKE